MLQQAWFARLYPKVLVPVSSVATEWHEFYLRVMGAALFRLFAVLWVDTKMSARQSLQ